MTTTIIRPLSLTAFVLLASLGAMLPACKPPSESHTKAVVGTDANGKKHAFSILPVKNFVEGSFAAVNVANNGVRYAKDLTDTQFFGIIDCMDTPTQTAEAALKGMETDAAIGNVYVDKYRHLWGRNLSTGKVDQKLPCGVFSSRIYSVYVLRQAMDMAYQAKPGATDFQVTQAVYLALRGNTVKGKTATLTPTMAAYVTANALHHGLGAIKTADLVAIITHFDQDLNPCDPNAGKFGLSKKNASYTCVPAQTGNNLFNYQPTGAAGGLTGFEQLLGNSLAQVDQQIYQYNATTAQPAEVMWEVLTSTTPWPSQTGRAGQVGQFLAGKAPTFNFNSFFGGATYGVANTSMNLVDANGLGLTGAVKSHGGGLPVQAGSIANKPVAGTRSGTMAYGPNRGATTFPSTNNNSLYNQGLQNNNYFNGYNQNVGTQNPFLNSGAGQVYGYGQPQLTGQSYTQAQLSQLLSSQLANSSSGMNSGFLSSNFSNNGFNASPFGQTSFNNTGFNGGLTSGWNQGTGVGGWGVTNNSPGWNANTGATGVNSWSNGVVNNGTFNNNFIGGPGTAIGAQQYGSQAEVVTRLQSELSSGQLQPAYGSNGQAPLETSGFTTLKEANGGYAFVGPSGVQDWSRASNTPNEYIDAAICDPNVGGTSCDPSNPAGFGLGQKVAVGANGVPQRAVVANFDDSTLNGSATGVGGFGGPSRGGIGSTGVGGSSLGVYQFAAGTDSQGHLAINCTDPSTNQQLTQFVSDYQRTQTGLQQQLTSSALTANRDQVQTEISKNQDIYNSVRNMATCGQTRGLGLALDDTDAAGCPFDGPANDVPPVDASDPTTTDSTTSTPAVATPSDGSSVSDGSTTPAVSTPSVSDASQATPTDTPAASPTPAPADSSDDDSDD